MAAGGEIVAKGSPKEIFSEVKLLAGCHVEPPVLGALFLEMKKYGIDLDVSLTVEEAARIIALELGSLKKNQSPIREFEREDKIKLAKT
jgi:hypothetical protein